MFYYYWNFGRDSELTVARICLKEQFWARQFVNCLTVIVNLLKAKSLSKI